MIIIGLNENWTVTITDNVSASATTTDSRWIVKRSSIERLIALNPPVPCSPPEHHKADAQWNAEKKRREIAGIKAAQRKHEIAKHSACKTTRKVLKYYREGKQQHATQTEAIAHKMNLIHKGFAKINDLWVYRCEFCKKWHVGHPTLEMRQRRAFFSDRH